MRKHNSHQLMSKLKLDLETLLQMSSTSCVYGLVNRSKKRIQIYSTRSLLTHLGRIMSEIAVSGEYKEMLQDMSDIELVILETNIEDNDLKLKLANWVDEYERKRYTFYKDIAPLRYTLETTVEYKSGRLSYCLYLVNRKRHRVLVGVFLKKQQLTSFVKSAYPSKRVSAVVYHESVIGT